MGVFQDIPLLGAGWETAAWRLLAAFAAGALVGMERERRERPAGLRTHALVSLTACLAMVVTLVLGGDPGAPSRVAAGVLTGIGFLGAGTIMRHGSIVRGLTTAASIWAAAAIGVALGVGWYLGAAVAIVLAVLTLTLLRLVEAPLRREPGLVRVEATLAAGQVFPEGLFPRLVENAIEVYDLDVESGEPSVLHLVLEPSGQLSPRAVLALVRSAPEIAEARLVERVKRRA
jgi:putative Mg2+ transporter-C (MgtC) family protein